MIQFQENAQTEGHTEGWGDPVIYDPSNYHQGPKMQLIFGSLETSSYFVL